MTNILTMPALRYTDSRGGRPVLRKSTSWVYKNWKELGGGKLGGSLFFPRKEDLYERIFNQREGVAIRLHPEGSQVHRGLVQNQKRGQARPKQKERRKY